ncbi:MAG: hypothetical protein IJH52_05105, partial [Oscillospiraceae bacterium]|nr:hypothetical protein [Oscillospiraceae bacterium]
TWTLVDKTVVEETDKSIYYFTVEDKGGSSIESITVQGYYSRRNHEDQKVPDKAYQISVAYEEGKADYSFQAKDFYWNYPVYYVITVVDKAGNKTEFNFDKPGSSGWADDEIGPEIHSVQSLTKRNDYVDKEIVEKNEKEINPWEYNDLNKTFYVGPNSVLNVTASDRSYVRMISLGEFEKTPPSGEYSNEFVATFSAEELKSLDTGEHSLIAYDWYTYGGKETGNSSPTNVKVNLVYDDQSPKLENVVYTMEDQSAFEKIAHAVSGGLMFHETVQVSFDLTEEGGSGIYAYYYQFAREGEDPSDWLIMPASSSQIKEKEGNVTLTLVVPDAYKTGEIVVSVFAEDNAGNVSLKDKNEADKVVLNEGKDVATHDATTVSEDGNLVVLS